jgi:hypothetical protein
VRAGWTYANYAQEVTFELAKDFSHAVSFSQLQKTKIWQILSGVGGEIKSDRTSLDDTMVKVADLALNHPEITSLDINPVFVYEDQFAGREPAPSMSRSLEGGRQPTVSKPSDAPRPLNVRPPRSADGINSAPPDPPSRSESD